METTLAVSGTDSPASKQAENGVTIPEFTGSFEPVPVTLGYKVGLVLVALAMALLLAVYVGLIVFTGLGVYYHIKTDAVIMEISRWGVIMYLWPAVAGTVLVFFMIKPIFASPPEQPPRYSLTAQSDPELFAFIGRICKMVRAPLPKRVDVDCEINASASFRRGIWSMSGNDVVLTIGLPLAAGLTLEEFAGVLAHEFGHFAQGAGMRLTYIIRATSRWFARVVYERDEWDVRLAKAAYSLDLRLSIWLHLIRFTIWVSRRVLWVLMHLGQVFSCFMLRQMEYDADRYETMLAGSDAFARTAEKLRDLNIAGVYATGKISESWNNRRLPRNVPAYIAISVKNVPAEMRKDLEEKRRKRRWRLFQTHPCDEDRVKASRALNQPGVFHSDQPASKLFGNFDELCAAATRFHYEHNLQLRITDNNLVAQEVAESDSQSQADGEQGLRDFFFGLKFVHRPVLISEQATESLPTEQARQELKNARQGMEQAKTEIQKALADYGQAETLYQRGYDAIRQESQQATTKASATMQQLAPTLERFEKNAAARLDCALQLLNEPSVAGQLPKAGAWQKEARQLRIVFARLGQAFGPLQELRRKFSALAAAISACNEETRRSSRLEAAEKRINELAPQIKDLIKTIRTTIEETAYPFHHAREDLTLQEFAKNDIPATHKLEALCNDCTCHLNRLLPLYQRVLGRLAFIAMQVEKQA